MGLFIQCKCAVNGTAQSTNIFCFTNMHVAGKHVGKNLTEQFVFTGDSAGAEYPMDLMSVGFIDLFDPTSAEGNSFQKRTVHFFRSGAVGHTDQSTAEVVVH